MRILKFKVFLVICSAIVFGISACSDSSSKTNKNLIDSGSWYETGFTPWPHDGNPYESENFVIFSDAASFEARKQLSEICEAVFTDIVDRFEITDFSIFQFPQDRNNKIHIYAYYNYTPMEWGGQAYYGGYLIYSPDHPQRSKWGHTAPEIYVPVVRHEMMHVVQTLIIGANDERLYSWFAEGIAIDISENSLYQRIDTQDAFDTLITTYGGSNPVAYHHSWEVPAKPEGIKSQYYYPMFWLAFRYMVDPVGHGSSYNDALYLIRDAADGIPFDTAMLNRFGMSQSEFENQFFPLMNEYLN